MPNTITTANDADGELVNIQIVPDGSTAWSSVTTYTKGLSIAFIEFKPSAANDHLMIRLNGATGNAILDVTSIDGGSMIIYLSSRRVNLYLLQTDCTFGTAGNVKIIIHLN